MAEPSIPALLASVPADGRHAVLVEIAKVQGSTPRDTDAVMMVTSGAAAGTIGGGHLEFHAIDLARRLIAEGPSHQAVELPLGPLMGQCCGGHVTLTFEPVDETVAERLLLRERRLLEERPAVLVFGLGHTGRALAAVLALLPFAVTLVDDRPEALADLPAACRLRHLPDPQEAVGDAPAGAAFIILTHSHALDYRLTEAALARGDAAYVGMIGSKTKRRRFESQFLRAGGSKAVLAQLTCPIGGADVDDKRPEIIASLTAAELVRCFARRAAGARPSAVRSHRA